MQLENAKGTRDFGPEEKIVRNEMVSKLQKVFELYGFSPLETPLIEKYELMLAKGSAGQESDALKEVFKLSDQGERKLALKFEQTLSFARFIGMNPTIKLPFKRYEIGPVFRDGPIKLGRYRQFWQCDVDVVGSKNMACDAEILSLALDSFKSLNLDAYLEINNRKILRGIIEFAGIRESLSDSVIVSIDKLPKIGRNGVSKELLEKKISEEKIERLLDAFDISGSNGKKIGVLKNLLNNEIGKEGISEVEQVLSFLTKEQVNNVFINVSLARGLGYYTGTIFEGYVKNSSISSSICGGGRYDNMIKSLINSDKDFPCVGISFGLDVLADVVKTEESLSQKTVSQVYIIPIKTLKDCLIIAKELRDSGVKTDLDFAGKNLSKNLDYASSQKIPYTIIVGSRELEEDKVKIRDMTSGEESLMTVAQAIRKMKSL